MRVLSLAILQTRRHDARTVLPVLVVSLLPHLDVPSLQCSGNSETCSSTGLCDDEW